MSDRPIVFVDTETTCLGALAHPWEIATIRREPDGREITRVAQVAYKLDNLPRGTQPSALHIGGWLLRGAPGTKYLQEMPEGVGGWRYDDEQTAARDVHRQFDGEPILVGVGVHFDAAVLSAMFSRAGRPSEPWHYAILDLKAETHGYLRALTRGRRVSEVERAALQLPLSSELLAAAVGVEPPDDDERHTALGDARWAARWFDALTGGAS